MGNVRVDRPIGYELNEKVVKIWLWISSYAFLKCISPLKSDSYHKPENLIDFRISKLFKSFPVNPVDLNKINMSRDRIITPVKPDFRLIQSRLMQSRP